MITTIRALAAESGAEILKVFRAPEFLIPSVALPVAFYSLFGLVINNGGDQATYLLATFGVFAVMAPALFGFGAGVAQERERKWLDLKRAAPAPASALIVAKTAATLAMAILSLVLVYAVAGLVGGVSLDAATWGRLFVVHVLAAIPFVFLGLMLGFSFGANGAVAAANILFLALASLGGLWIPVFLFPDALQLLSKALPSYHLSEIALGVVDAPRMGEDGPRDLRGHAIAVSAMTVAFAALAAWVWARKR